MGSACVYRAVRGRPNPNSINILQSKCIQMLFLKDYLLEARKPAKLCSLNSTLDFLQSMFIKSNKRRMYHAKAVTEAAASSLFEQSRASSSARSSQNVQETSFLVGVGRKSTSSALRCWRNPTEHLKETLKQKSPNQPKTSNAEQHSINKVQ